ncbi:S41 family peptidase [Kordiimonas sp.]|uniref:S41 family peptidase n=1 Tax=Kordiimonas sp. TaxID=1970157 RepID=UPI003A8FC11E
MRKLVTGTLMALMMALPVHADKQANQDDFYEQLDLLMRIFERVRSEYVDEVDDKEVIEAAIQGMLRSLDPHSTYLNPDVYQQVRVQMEGEYGGLGIEVQMENGVVKVVSPIDDTPADKAGIKGGDFITHIDGSAVMGKTLTEAVKTMRGPVGSPIIVTVVRDGADAPFDIEIVREKIMVRSVRHRVEDETIGYIRVTTFNMQTGEGVEDAIASLVDELGPSLDGVILDLRNNPGGLLDEAIRVSDAFLDRGEIVSTRGRRRQNNNRWYATTGDLLDGVPIVVLTNAYSASASEIVAGALQDHRRAVVVGDKTFGKGTVQSEIRLGRSGDRAIRLTTARYFTPSGRSIQERGVEPDIQVLFPRPQGQTGNPRREADLTGHIQNDQDSLDLTGEEDIALEAEVTDAQVLEDVESGKQPVDVQLRYAIKLLKDMSSLPKSQVAEVRQPAGQD